jgi:hypothetical protein
MILLLPELHACATSRFFIFLILTWMFWGFLHIIHSLFAQEMISMPDIPLSLPHSFRGCFSLSAAD